MVNATANGNYDLYLDNEKVLEKALLTEAVTSVERISFRTGTYRNHPDRKTPNQVKAPPLAGADEKQEVVTYFIDNFKADSMN